MHFGVELPITAVAAPAIWVELSGLATNADSFCKELNVQALETLIGRYESSGAVRMVFVAPSDKMAEPKTRSKQEFNGFFGINIASE
jgi:hypothetical protein